MARKTRTAMWRVTHHKIYLNIIRYVTGPKFRGRYDIDGRKALTRADVVRIVGNDGFVVLKIYFDTRIRISTGSAAPYLFAASDAPVPEDDADYVRIVTAFLRELIRHAALLSGKCRWGRRYPVDYIDPNGRAAGGATAGFGEMPDGAPEGFRDVCRCHELLLGYPYRADDPAFLEWLTGVMAGKAFRRSRGDYKRSTAGYGR